MLEYNTFKDWLIGTLGPMDDDSDTCYLGDLATHGADCGVPGLTYYTDTVKLYDQYTDELWDTLRQMAQDMGCAGVLGFLVDYAGGNDQEMDYQFKNMVVWVVAEKIAADYIDERDNEEEWGH